MPQFCYDYPHPAVATDVSVFTLIDEELSLLLILRKEEPYAGRWALPGGFLREDEDLDACARRELQEEAGIEIGLITQFQNFSDPKRDPRQRVISVAYFALTPSAEHRLRADTDAVDARWFSTTELPALAFDHESIIRAALASLRGKINDLEPENLKYLLAFLPKTFTFASLQQIFETIMGTPVDKRNFRKRVSMTGVIQETGEFSRGMHRPAQLFELVDDKGTNDASE